MNHEIFLENTYLYNNFNISKNYAMAYLKKLLDEHDLWLNDQAIESLDYEKILYIEQYFTDEEDIQLLIKQLKNIIIDNWIKKQKLLIRLS